jgi:hypothetical protein
MLWSMLAISDGQQALQRKAAENGEFLRYRPRVTNEGKDRFIRCRVEHLLAAV